MPLLQYAPPAGPPSKSNLLPLSIQAAPRSGSSPRTQKQRPCSLSPIEQPRATGAPPEAATSLRPRSSPAAQRELPQKHQPPPSLNRAAALRSGSSPRSSLISPSIKQPRAAGAPPEAATSLRPWSSPAAQRELPQKHQPPPSLNRAAALRSGSSPRSSLLPLSIEQPRAAGAPPRSSLFSPSMEQLRAEGAPPEAASSLSQSSSPAQRELPQK